MLVNAAHNNSVVQTYEDTRKNVVCKVNGVVKLVSKSLKQQ